MICPAARAKAREEEVHLETLRNPATASRTIQNRSMSDGKARRCTGLDDVAICRGSCCCARTAALSWLAASMFLMTHPLAYLRPQSILGHAPDRSFAEGVDALNRRLTLLFEALHARMWDRIDPGGRVRPGANRQFRSKRVYIDNHGHSDPDLRAASLSASYRIVRPSDSGILGGCGRKMPGKTFGHCRRVQLGTAALSTY